MRHSFLLKQNLFFKYVWREFQINWKILGHDGFVKGMVVVEYIDEQDLQIQIQQKQQVPFENKTRRSELFPRQSFGCSVVRMD